MLTRAPRRADVVRPAAPAAEVAVVLAPLVAAPVQAAPGSLNAGYHYVGRY